MTVEIDIEVLYIVDRTKLSRAVTWSEPVTVKGDVAEKRHLEPLVKIHLYLSLIIEVTRIILPLFIACCKK